MKQYYNYLLNSFTLCARTSNIVVNFAPVAPQNTFHYKFPCDRGESHLQTLRPLHLRGCRTSSGSVVDVLVSFTEHLDPRDPRVTVQSRVAVAYFDVDLSQNRASMLLGVHYDFEKCDGDNEPWPSHPRFHAQISHDVISAQQIQLIADTFSYQFALAAGANLSEVARIPTAHMCLGSVLVCLAADFFSREAFRSFMSEVREYADVFPKPRTKELLDNISADKNSLRSCAWYHRAPRETAPTRAARSNTRGHR